MASEKTPLPATAVPPLRRDAEDTHRRLAKLDQLAAGLTGSDPPMHAGSAVRLPSTSATVARPEPVGVHRSPENQLVQVRLGIASSLFSALRARHADTAAHSLRVTLGCSAWALMLDMSEEQRDIIEVASLLHDIGKIGVPDSVLLKPAALTPDEFAIMDRHRRIGVEILRPSCASPEILNIVANASAWYGGGRPNSKLKGNEIPLGARMLAIVDAFDAMTSDQVYRRAMSRERAFSELFRNAGTQFDPDLVKVFAAFHECDQLKLHEQVARKWLDALDIDRVHSPWRLNLESPTLGEAGPELLFQQKMLDNMRDAVVFVDATLQILLWNPGAERLTGIASGSILQHRFRPTILELRDDDGFEITDSDCPVARVIESGEQYMRRLELRSRNGKETSIEAHIVPVVGSDGTTHGATLVMRDVSPELSLEARCHSLHEQATKDPLTQVANRAEFNRVHEMFVAAHLERRLPCSLIIADIDHFKSVNDTYGHPAGDDVLKGFAKVLKGSCRQGDLVARYGGEEFVMLCAHCDNATAARRAEEMRRTLAQLPQPALGNRNITASFGVTEIQLGDTPATMLARADRALYDAKERGRNTVVQLGTGIAGDGDDKAGAKKNAESNMLAVQDLVTMVPLSVAIEKLRGFVADHNGEVASIDGNQVRLKIGESPGFFRRSSDRQVPFLLDLRFEEKKAEDAFKGGASTVRTSIRAVVSPQRSRDRRRTDAVERARQLMSSFKAYLMAVEDDAPPEPSVQKRGKDLMLPWWKRKK